MGVEQGRLDRYVAIYQYGGAIRTFLIEASTEQDAMRQARALVAAPVIDLIKKERTE